jgi:hypothetical protein
MKEVNHSSPVDPVTASDQSNLSQPADENVEHHWQGAVKRRSFLKGISLAGATVTAGALMGKQLSAETTRSSRRLRLVSFATCWRNINLGNRSWAQ